VGGVMKRRKQIIVTFICLIFLLSGCGSLGKNAKENNLTPENPVAISVWVYYNGAQLESFNKLVTEFNETMGKEKGVLVDVYSHGTVNELTENVLATQGKAGLSEVPNIFSAYADTAYKIDSIGLLADLSQYLSQEEQEEYIQSYLSEGCFSDDGSMKIFPIAKSVEVFMLNKTDWDKFSLETGVTTQEFSTIEGLVEVAEKYYNWTDSLTPTPNDGKAFFGRDAMANYFFLGAMQQGHELIAIRNGQGIVELDRDVMKKLWDNYYIPYIKGYFASVGRFRSDDVKMGSIISFVGSSSGATFFPDRVILSDVESYPIEMEVFQTPKFADGENFAVQQGAGMVVTRGTEQEVKASVEFLKWITQPEQDIAFSIDSGYLRVTKEANQMDIILENKPEVSETMKRILTVGLETVNESRLFTPHAFEKGWEVREILTYSMEDLAKADRLKVEARLNQGMSLERAVAEFTTERYFDQWYEDILQEIEDVTT